MTYVHRWRHSILILSHSSSSQHVLSSGEICTSGFAEVHVKIPKPFSEILALREVGKGRRRIVFPSERASRGKSARSVYEGIGFVYTKSRCCKMSESVGISVLKRSTTTRRQLLGPRRSKRPEDLGQTKSPHHV